jgi:hypothetical protein
MKECTFFVKRLREKLRALRAFVVKNATKYQQPTAYINHCKPHLK